MTMDIPHIAKLARLHIDAGQLPEFERDMELIVEMVRHLPKEDELPPLDQELFMELRPDIPEDGKFTRDEMLSNAPMVQSGCLAVPKTVE